MNFPTYVGDITLGVSNIAEIRVRRESKRFRARLFVSSILPRVPILNRLDFVTFEMVTEGFEPDGFKITNLFFFPRLLASQLILSGGKSFTTDVWFAKPLLTIGAGFLQLETDLVSEQPYFRRFRAGVSLHHLMSYVIPPLRFLRDAFTEACWGTHGGVLASMPLVYKRRLVELDPVQPGNLSTVNLLGFSLFIAAPFSSIDIVLEFTMFFPIEDNPPQIPGYLSSGAGYLRAGLQFRYSFKRPERRRNNEF